MEKENLNLSHYKGMENFIGKENNFSPIYDSTSIMSALKTYLCGSCKPLYNGSIIELLGKNAIDIFEKYQVWVKLDTYYIDIDGFDGISFGFDEEFIITWVSFGRSFEGEKIIAKASDYARINHLGIKVTRHGNMRGIYYSVELIDKYIDTPYLGVESTSTLSDEKRQQLYML